MACRRTVTLVSKTFRTIALEAWFETFFATLPAHVLDAWPEVGTWTRELHCVEHGSDHDKLPFQWDLRAFNRLRKLRLDFNPLVSNAMLLLRFAHPKHVAGNLQELELRVLKLAQERIWCGLCNICCLATFKEQPPQEIIYENYVGLPMHYGQFLADLEHLHTVCLTVGYGHGGNTSITENNENLWSGECDACMAMMYATDDFRVDWVERKKSQPRPPSLRRVEWRFNAAPVVTSWFAGGVMPPTSFHRCFDVAETQGP
ncbi:hypothetical protein A0H81_01978 [Grifola frondosa]|uniref:Uncharacterized protein n=1 Tax=Grifola frondosa TaxID=5627 RepID=A0A1C7MKV7_GRIFR|nr:hypothetical protein A0H81_01978 [Grifola frondosa]